MVRRNAGTSSRGFGLVEAMVAVVVFAIGVAGAVATATLAARVLREAEAREAAVRLAGEVLDSLFQEPEPGPGELRRGRHRLSWAVRRLGPAAGIDLLVEYHDGSRARRLRFETAHTAPLLRPRGDR